MDFIFDGSDDEKKHEMTDEVKLKLKFVLWKYKYLVMGSVG